MATTKNINPYDVPLEDAKAFALGMIRAYVERGDTPDQITEGGMGCGGPTYSAQIGGWCHAFNETHHFNRYRLIITELDSKPCLLIFNIHELIAEIKQPVKQMTLF